LPTAASGYRGPAEKSRTRTYLPPSPYRHRDTPAADVTYSPVRCGVKATPSTSWPGWFASRIGGAWNGRPARRAITGPSSGQATTTYSRPTAAMVSAATGFPTEIESVSGVRATASHRRTDPDRVPTASTFASEENATADASPSAGRSRHRRSAPS
jgi:hypothetical protein